MYLNHTKSKSWQYFLYWLNNIVFLSAGAYGFSHNNWWFCFTFYVGVGLQLLQALLYGLTVLWCLPEDRYKVAIQLALNGKYVHNWVENIIDGLYMLLMLYYLHWLIAAAYLVSTIIMARVKCEVRWLTGPAATITYDDKKINEDA